MKSSLEQIKKLALEQRETREKLYLQSFAPLDDHLAQATKDMQEMRSCYDDLLSAAAATANSAYEFSESLREMGTCLLERTGSSAYGESEGVLQMLGKAQLELQEIVDAYRSHVVRTITIPSESLLSELRKVEEMKSQCDDKREVYEHMLARYREKGKFGIGNGEQPITSQQVKEARIEYDEAARLCIFRAKSLKQGQCHSLLTQAARHHTAQLHLFRNGFKSLVEIDPRVRLVSEKQRIDCQVGLDEGEDYGSEMRNSYENNKHVELDEADLPNPHFLNVEEAARTFRKNHEAQTISQRPRPSSHSAPIYTEKLNPADKGTEIHPSVQKLQTYVLPTPARAKILSAITTRSGLQSSSTSLSTSSTNLRHSFPLHTERNSNSSPIPPPPPDRCSFTQFERHNSFDLNRNKRQAYSDPIPSKPIVSTSGPLTSKELPSGLLSRIPVSQLSTSANVSYSASPAPVSSPRITELHELPRPPDSIALKTLNSSSIAHSAPLAVRNHEHPPSNKSPKLASNIASRLLASPLIVPRSFSMPARSSKAKPFDMGASQILDQVEDFTSPPLSPISISDMKPLSSISKQSPVLGK
ncbi:hypothetical protein DCAR_0519005 [Daucus carota subsp. sativus]|uniref:BAR domain-containing protein n=1 Tax=Daucus carota subsp. sativus TaxID=79200 RepID=A0AAF0X321_DAUCS|nr:hypothetical protein DCAR_0519005 [Daucus carota subsp. sativus]